MTRFYDAVIIPEGTGAAGPGEVAVEAESQGPGPA
jgi:hypothetical protein